MLVAQLSLLIFVKDVSRDSKFQVLAQGPIASKQQKWAREPGELEFRPVSFHTPIQPPGVQKLPDPGTHFLKAIRD